MLTAVQGRASAASLGSGTQYMSWIAIDDLLGVDPPRCSRRSDLAGPVNAVAPEPVTNAAFTKTLGRVLGRPTIAPVPAFALRLAVRRDGGRRAARRARASGPERLLATGYRFRFPELEGALRHLLGRPPR